MPPSEYARDDDGDGFCEVHVNTLEGILVVAAKVAPPAPGEFPRRSLPLYLGFFEFVHNVRAAARGCWVALIGLSVGTTLQSS